MTGPAEQPSDSEPLAGVARLLDVVARLRSDTGCPWDREQTIQSLKPYLIEECYETLEAIDSGDAARHAEELGDVLLQIVLQAQISRESGGFSFDDVARCLTEKLIRRHPHVFGDTTVSGSAQVLQNWEAIKSAEGDGGPKSVLDGVPRHLPALQKAQRVQTRVARVGFDWDDVGDVLAKVEEELGEVRQAMAEGDEDAVAEELGDLLFAVVNLGRFLGHEAEQALQSTVGKFGARFQEVERRIREDGRDVADCSLVEMDAHWEAVKKELDHRRESSIGARPSADG